MEYEELSDISDYANWLDISPIDIGASGDNKYHILRNNGTELILRTSDIRNYKRHCSNAVFAQYIYKLTGIRMNIPVEVAACCSDKLAYTIYSWVDGVNADEKIPNMHIPDQSHFGEMAGVLLKKIHSIPAPDSVMPWDRFFGERIDRILGAYKLSRLSFDGDRTMLDFIEESRPLLAGRPQSALHGDFRSGNLVIDSAGDFGVIDFDRWCWGDPYMDFQCIRRSCTTAFSRGQIIGYFEGNIPGDFFSLMALYVAVDAIQRICAASAGGQDELARAYSYAKRIMREYNDFGGLVPTWY